MATAAEPAGTDHAHQPQAAPPARPLSIERRASMFNKLFKPSIERMFVPVVNEPCEHFEVRKGAFAALGRCAKCNFKEDEHGKKHQHALSMKDKTLLDKKAKYSDEEERVHHSGETRAEEDKHKETPLHVESGSSGTNDDRKLPPVAEETTEPPEKETSLVAPPEAASVKSDDEEKPVVISTEPVDNVPAVIVTVSDIEDEEFNDEDVDVIDVKDDDDDNEEPQAEEGEEEEEEVERPSWAPPPLIDVSTLDVSTNENGPESPPRRARAMSWLRSRTGSSSASSDTSGSSMGNKRASLKLLASQIKAKMTKAKETWETKVGDLPKCNRCGRVIDPHHKVVSAGMERFHEICPTKEESEQGPRNCRYFVQKCQERVVLTFRCDKDTKQPYSFIFDLAPDARQTNLRKPNTSEMVLAYIPDVKSHASLERKFRVPKTREFDISVRYSQNFQFINPATNESCAPQLDLTNKSVTIIKHCTTNGVLHSIEARFVYDEDERIIKPVHLELRFAMMPGAIARLPTIIQRRRNSAVMKRLEEKQQQQQSQKV